MNASKFSDFALANDLPQRDNQVIFGSIDAQFTLRRRMPVKVPNPIVLPTPRSIVRSMASIDTQASPAERKSFMLVLSRKKSEKIWFPAFNTSVEVVEIRGGTVRLGIQAPRAVAVLREEVPDKGAQWAAAIVPQPEWRRLLCNRLNLTESGLLRVSQQLQAGQVDDAQTTLEKLREDCRMLRRRLEGDVEKRPPAGAPKRTSCRALLVEDNQNERELLAGLLRIAGVEVATAGDGADALDYLRTHDKPDVVLLDMGLPRLDGAATLREIRREPTFAGLKVIGVSGHQPEEFNLEQSPRGINRWFQKPVDPAALLHELETSVCGA